MPHRLIALLLAVAATVCATGATAATAVAPGFDWLRFAAEFKRAMAADAAGAWRQVPWQGDAAAAAAEARRSGKPLFVFVYVTVPAYLPGESGMQVCPGGRATRGTALADPAVIAELRRDFVCLALDVRSDGFPAVMRGLGLCEAIYKGYPGRDRGFSVSCALTSDGQHLLGSSGIGTVATYRKSACYDPGRFARFLSESAGRAQRWRAADGTGRAGIDAEVWRSLLETTRRAGD